MHPIDFLHRLNEYFTIKQLINTDEKLIIAGDCLKATASNWFTTIRFQIYSYQDFQNAFRDEYWSRDIQMQVWIQCLTIKHIQPETSYREHFSYWANKLRHLEVPRLAEAEIVRNIAGHYPGYLRAILISSPECTILSAMKILGTEEHRRPGTNESNNYVNRTTQNRENNNSNNFREQPRREDTWNNRQGTRQDYTRNYQVPRTNQEPRRDTNQNNSQQWREHRPINQLNIETTPETESSESQPTHTINNIQTNNKSVSPYVKCMIEGEAVTALIDTGATISVINKELADQLIKRDQQIPILPISGVQISNAVGKKICKVSRQLFCSCQIGETQLFINFVQLENLNEQAIIGADVLNQYNAHINFTNKTIQWLIKGEPRITPFFENSTNIKSDQITHIEAVEESMTDIVISQKEREALNQLLENFQEIFSDNPGYIYNYECQIKVTPGEPICQRPYPIPISKLSKMDKEIQRMIELGIIERSDSPWSSPIVGVEKKSGDIRLCLDA